ncbi:hypothetical protein ROTMU0001_0651 [Rothia mucilaginosa ATCC 25296]|nr:hypothetical protein ROTMU0001_0651 [Rothia mucilaginosa ATCC 25296]
MDSLAIVWLLHYLVRADARGVNLQYLPRKGRSNLGCVTRYSRSRC